MNDVQMDTVGEQRESAVVLPPLGMQSSNKRFFESRLAALIRPEELALNSQRTSDDPGKEGLKASSPPKLRSRLAFVARAGDVFPRQALQSSQRRLRYSKNGKTMVERSVIRCDPETELHIPPLCFDPIDTMKEFVLFQAAIEAMFTESAANPEPSDSSTQRSNRSVSFRKANDNPAGSLSRRHSDIQSTYEAEKQQHRQLQRLLRKASVQKMMSMRRSRSVRSSNTIKATHASRNDDDDQSERSYQESDIDTINTDGSDSEDEDGGSQSAASTTGDQSQQQRHRFFDMFCGGIELSKIAMVQDCRAMIERRAVYRSQMYRRARDLAAIGERAIRNARKWNRIRKQQQQQPIVLPTIAPKRTEDSESRLDRHTESVSQRQDPEATAETTHYSIWDRQQNAHLNRLAKVQQRNSFFRKLLFLIRSPQHHFERKVAHTRDTTKSASTAASTQQQQATNHILQRHILNLRRSLDPSAEYSDEEPAPPTPPVPQTQPTPPESNTGVHNSNDMPEAKKPAIGRTMTMMSLNGLPRIASFGPNGKLFRLRSTNHIVAKHAAESPTSATSTINTPMGSVKSGTFSNQPSSRFQPTDLDLLQQAMRRLEPRVIPGSKADDRYSKSSFAARQKLIAASLLGNSEAAAEKGSGDENDADDERASVQRRGVRYPMSLHPTRWIRTSMELIRGLLLAEVGVSRELFFALFNAVGAEVIRDRDSDCRTLLQIVLLETRVTEADFTTFYYGTFLPNHASDDERNAAAAIVAEYRGLAGPQPPRGLRSPASSVSQVSNSRYRYLHSIRHSPSTSSNNYSPLRAIASPMPSFTTPRQAALKIPTVHPHTGVNGPAVSSEELERLTEFWAALSNRILRKNIPSTLNHARFVFKYFYITPSQQPP